MPCFLPSLFCLDPTRPCSSLMPLAILNLKPFGLIVMSPLSGMSLPPPLLPLPLLIPLTFKSGANILSHNSLFFLSIYLFFLLFLSFSFSFFPSFLLFLLSFSFLYCIFIYFFAFFVFLFSNYLYTSEILQLELYTHLTLLI